MSRTVTFEPNGVRAHAAPADIVAAWRGHSTLVAPCYALGTAQHETNFTLNECDTEVSGYVSMGLYQIGTEEMTQVGLPYPANDPYDLDTITRVMVSLAEARLKRIAAAAKFDIASPPADAWAYLAVAHNEGLGAALKTIAAHGLNWAAWKARNPQLADMAAYGDDCISGGTHASVLDGRLVALVKTVISDGFAAMVATKPATAADACDQIATFYYAYASAAMAGPVPATLVPLAKTTFSKTLKTVLDISPPSGTPAQAAAGFVAAVTTFWLTPPVVFGAGAVTVFTGAPALLSALTNLFSQVNTSAQVADGIATALDTATKTVGALIPPATSPVLLT